MLTGGALRAKPDIFRRRGKGLVGCSASPTSGAAEVAEGVANVGNFDVSREYGVTPPCGRPGAFIWDPAGLATNIDESTFRQYRQAELKHGRICMMAMIGLIVQAFFKFSQFQGAPSGIAAARSGEVSSPALGIIFLLVGIIEFNTSDEGREPGDYGDPLDIADSGLGMELGVPAKDSFGFSVWRDFELNHSRLAMIGFLGSVLAECATGFNVVDQWKAAGPAWNRTTAILLFPDSPVPPLEAFIGWYPDSPIGQ